MIEGWQDRCDRVFFGGVGVVDVARHPHDISKIAGICCDSVCATLCSATGVTAMVCPKGARERREREREIRSTPPKVMQGVGH